jgi:hypothetical protein
MTITLKETLSSITYYDTNGNEARVELADIHADLRDAVLRYGVKQILADAGAASRGTSEADRMARIQRRAQALRDGTWGLRPARALVDGEVFDAAVAAGLLQDDDASRARWAGLRKVERNAVRAMPEVAAQLPKSDVGVAILAMFGAAVPDQEPVDPESDAAVFGDDSVETEPAKRRRRAA